MRVKTASTGADSSIQLNDGATRIFLYTRGKNEDEVSKDLVELLHSMEISFNDEDDFHTDNKKIDKLASVSSQSFL